MGNAAAKELESTELGQCALHKEDGTSIAPNLVTTETVTKIKSKETPLKGNSWHDENKDGKVLLKFHSKGMMKKRSIIEDGDGKEIASVLPVGMFKKGSHIVRETPSFDGQEALTAEELKKSGMPEDAKVYGFAKIETKTQMSTATSTYSVVTGKDPEKDDFTYKELYVGNKLSAMNFLGIVKTAEDDTPVLKAKKGMGPNVSCEVGSGVDLVAVILVVQSLVSPDGTAGALAGAGVI